jgi:hypothetical protein
MHHGPGNIKEDRLPGVEANIRAFLEGLKDQEHNCRDNRDVGKTAGALSERPDGFRSDMVAPHEAASIGD